MRMPTTEQDSLDRADMERLVAGHDTALNELMNRHAGAVFGFLCRMVGNEDDANDLAQETFVRVYRSRKHYQPRHRFVTWLYTIAANLARNHLRWRSRHPTLSVESPRGNDGTTLGETLVAGGATPSEASERREQQTAVQVAVGKLPEDLRAALVLCEWEELSMADAAEILGTTPKAIDSRLYRARKQLRQELTRWIER